MVSSLYRRTVSKLQAAAEWLSLDHDYKSNKDANKQLKIVRANEIEC